MAAGRFTMPVAVFLILEQDGKIWLQKRANTGYRDGFYDLPAGHVDGGETAQQAVIREAEEEAGIELHENDLRVVHVLHNNDGVEYIDIFLYAEKWTGSPYNAEPNKCDDARWFSRESLPTQMTPHVKSALEHIGRGVFYSNHGWDSPSAKI